MSHTVSEAPESGYRIRRVFAVKQSHELLKPGSVDSSKQSRDVTFAWDWRVVEPHTMEVFFSVDLGPSHTAAETLRYGVIGTFELVGTPTVSVKDFVLCNAIATLLPFVREGLANMSSRGPFGPYYLPPLNAIRIAENLSYDEATGSKQLASDPRALEAPPPGNVDGA